MFGRAPAAVLTLLLGAGLGAGCGNASDAATTEESPSASAAATRTATTADSPTLPPAAPVIASPAHGPLISGTGYRFRVPRGWRDVTSTLGAHDRVDRAAGSRQPEHGFNSNVNVVVTRGALSPAQVASVTHSIRDRIRRTAPSYAVRQPVLVAGERAGHLAGLRSRAKPPYWLEQYVFSHRKHAYVLSFSFSPRVPAQQRRNTIAGVLASWAWR